ncbi:MAG: AEC family transporter [Anaerolineales bacterium]
MNDLIRIFTDNLLPVFLASGSGFLLSKLLKINPRPISQAILYIFAPSLLFTLLTNNDLNNNDILRSMLFIGFTILIVGAFAITISRIFRLNREFSSGLLLTSMFMNSGNYGLPVVLFAFGEAALGYASVYFVTMTIFTYTIGILIASMGTTDIKTSFINLLKLPTIYAVVIAFVLIYTGWEIPVFLDRTITLLGDASIPSMLVLLGMQLANVRLPGISLPLLLAVSIRLIISPAVALLLTVIFGIFGPARMALITIAGMPTAVFTTVLSTEYDLNPSFVTAVVFTSTLLSPLSLTPILSLLGV